MVHEHPLNTPMLPTARIAGRCVVAAIATGLVVAAISAGLGVAGAATIGGCVAAVGAGAVLVAAGLLMSFPPRNVASAAGMLMAASMVRLVLSVAGAVVIQLTLKPHPIAFVMGVGVSWCVVTAIEIATAAPGLRASDGPRVEGSVTR